MDIGTIATILALFAAVYALLPRYYWQELNLKIDLLTKVYLILISFLLFFLQFKNSIVSITEKYGFHIELDYLGKDFFSLFIHQDVMLGLLFLLLVPFIVSSKKITRGNYQNFISLCHELLYREKYHEVLELIVKNIDQIKKISNKESLYEKLLYKLKIFVFKHANQNIKVQIIFDKDFDEDSPEVNRLVFILNRIKEFLFRKTKAILYPNQLYYYQKNVAFAESCEEIFNDQNFIDFLITRRSDTILKIIQSNILDERSRSLLFYNAILNTNSFLFKEFKYSNFNNGVTKYLFENPKKCEEMALYKPVGEAVIDYLDNQSKLDRSKDKYNGTMSNFDPHSVLNERVKSPIYVGIWFFREMISSAFEAEIEWHMWLYYYEHFLSRITQNLEPHSPGEYEFPSQYHFLIYELLNAMTDLVDEISMYPEKSNLKSARIEKVDLEHDNGSIIKSAMKCLGKCIKIILESHALTDYDKKYFLDIVFYSYFRLTENNELKRYAEQYLLFIKYGGGLYGELVQPQFVIDYLLGSEFKIKLNSYKQANEVIDNYYDPIN